MTRNRTLFNRPLFLIKVFSLPELFHVYLSETQLINLIVDTSYSIVNKIRKL